MAEEPAWGSQGSDRRLGAALKRQLYIRPSIAALAGADQPGALRPAATGALVPFDSRQKLHPAQASAARSSLPGPS